MACDTLTDHSSTDGECQCLRDNPVNSRPGTPIVLPILRVVPQLPYLTLWQRRDFLGRTACNLRYLAGGSPAVAISHSAT